MDFFSRTGSGPALFLPGSATLDNRALFNWESGDPAPIVVAGPTSIWIIRHCVPVNEPRDGRLTLSRLNSSDKHFGMNLVFL